jgi:hypothetical protein
MFCPVFLQRQARDVAFLVRLFAMSHRFRKPLMLPGKISQIVGGLEKLYRRSCVIFKQNPRSSASHRGSIVAGSRHQNGAVYHPTRNAVAADRAEVAVATGLSPNSEHS